MSEVKCTNLRFNLDKPVQRAAWECLQTMDKTRFKSYSQVIALAIVDYFDRLEKLQDDPYLETREREERFVGQIVVAVERAMKDALPVYLAGCMTGLTQAAPPAPSQTPTPEANAEDIDWGYLGK